MASHSRSASSYGGFVALLPSFTVDNFGRHLAADIMGLIYTSRALAGLLGPPRRSSAHRQHPWLLAASGDSRRACGTGCYLLQVRPVSVEV